MTKRLSILALLALWSAPCIHAQQVKLGGTGGAGGTAGIQTVGQPFSITTSALPDAPIGSSYNQTLVALYGTTPYNWTIAFGTLPPGLIINSATGVVSGTPTTVGNYVFTVVVTDSTTPTAKTATQQLSIAVTCPALSITNAGTLPVGTIGTAYSFQFNASGGQGAVTWTATGLTDLGLSSGGLLAGTPTLAQTQTFTMTATDSCPVPQTATAQATLTVNAGLQIVTPSALPSGVQGNAYSLQFAAQGGTAPYTWLVTTGTLPPGLSLGGSGALTGTPSAAGNYSFTVQVADSASSTATAPFTVTISCTPLAISTAALPNGSQGVPYNFQLTSTGGTGAILWSATGLPNGLTVSASGSITGSPSQSGPFTPIFTATDSCSTPQSVSTTIPLSVSTGLTITSTSPLPNGIVGTPYNTSISVSGGVPPYTWSTPAGPVPAGAVDMLDWALMPLPDRNNFCMTGGATPKCSVQNGGMFWWVKSYSGWASDMQLYDDQYVYEYATENNDSSQQAACQTANNYPGTGPYSSCFLDPYAYKMAVNLSPAFPRYFVPGTTVTLMTPPVLQGGSQVNPFIRTTNCGLDNQPLVYLGNKKFVTSGPFTNINFGGAIGTAPYIENDYYYSGDVNGVYQNLEKRFFVKPYGWVRFELWSLVGGVYTFQSGSTNNAKTAHAAVTPNFGCGVPALPQPGVLPPGTPLTSSPSLNLKDSTGAITGTPTTAGTHSFTVQVEDAAGTITQKQFTMTTTCPVLALTSTSPLPLATVGQPYSFQFTATGGAAPIAWARIQGSLPAGLTLSASGLLNGTPTQTGVFNPVVQVIDSCAPSQQSAQSTFQLSVQANSGPLTITTTSPLQAATEGASYTATVNATGGTTPYTWTLSSGSLPSGLAMTTAGVISGTPTATGTSSFTVRVTDALSGTTTKGLSITVSCTALAISTTSPLPGASQGQLYSFQFASTGGRGTVSWSASGVPAGLTLASSGLLSGTPTGSGTSSLNVTATDQCAATPQTANGTFSLTTAAAPPPLVISTTSPLPAGTQGSAYSTQMAATGGVGPYTWTILSGTLPAGLTLTSGGVISGTPTTIGTTSVTLQVSDTASHTASGSFSITISCVPLAIASGLTLPTGTQNQAYSDQLAATGGTGALTWSLVGGAFPSGVSISSSGLVSGTPSASGSFSPQLRVTDACSTPQTATSTFSLTINPVAVPLQITTASPLPSGTQNQAYSVTLSATGGTPPYGSWAVTIGSLPAGLTLGPSTGLVSGTPSASGTSTFTVSVTDAASTTATKAFSLTVNATTSDDSRYCTSANTVTGLSKDGPANPLTACFNTALANTPSPGSTVTVTAGNCASLQSAISGAVAGQTIVVPALNGAAQDTFTSCPIAPSAAGNANNWITVRTSAIASLPPEGSRISPAYAGVPSLHLACPTGSVGGSECGRPAYAQPASPGVYMPRIVANTPVINFGTSAAYWRFIGIEVTSTSGANGAQVVSFPATGSHIIMDRMVVHGGNSTTGQDRDNIQAGVRISSTPYSAVINSYIYDIHCLANGTCVDSQAVFVGGSGATDGPIKVVNNFLEVSGEGTLSGGGGQGTTTQPASDVEIRRNHFFKPVFWKSNDPSYFGTNFLIKNGTEMKNTARALVEGNIFDQNWANQSDQQGNMLIFGARNQSSTTGGTASSNGSGTLNAITGTFNANVVAAGCATPNHCNVKYNGVTYQAQTWTSTKIITVSPAPPAASSASFTACVPGLNPNANVIDITFRYNVIRHTARGFEIAAVASDCGDLSLGGSNISVHDIVADDINGPRWSLAGSCCFYSDGFQLANFQPAGKNLHDITFRHLTLLPALASGTPGPGGPVFGFGAQSVAGSGILRLKIYDSISAAGLTSGNAAVCAANSSATSLLQCWDKLNNTAQNSYCFDHNALAVQTTGTILGTGNNPPYPTTTGATASPGCGFTLTGTALPANYAAFQFTSLNGANGGNYTLLNTSPYHNAATDGSDLGANIGLVSSYTAGVQ